MSYHFFNSSSERWTWAIIPGFILENKGVGVIFQKRGKEMLKKGKIFDNLGKTLQNLRSFIQREGDNCT